MSDSIRGAIKAHIAANPGWLDLRKEETVEPNLKIVDPHHHIWDMPDNRYMFADLMADFESGHNVVGSVHMQCHSMYRSGGPREMQPVGETEFINGVAAQSASGEYGTARVCAGIVGTADLLLGSAVEPVLDAHLIAGGGRFRGIRPSLAWHECDQVRALDVPPHILMEKSARAAIGCLDRLNLSLDVWVFFTQLDEVIDVCRSFPGLTVIVNHTGGPLGIGPYVDKRDVVFDVWRSKIETLAQCPNAVIKLGGMASRYSGFRFNELPQPPSSDLLAKNFKPYFDVCIENFGPRRCMLESNFPIDRGMCSYHILWNAYKKLTQGHSAEDRSRLFSETAIATYKLDIQ